MFLELSLLVFKFSLRQFPEDSHFAKFLFLSFYVFVC